MSEFVHFVSTKLFVHPDKIKDGKYDLEVVTAD